MNTIKMLLILSLIFMSGYAQNTTLKTSYGSLDFTNSKKKDSGKTYSIGINHQNDSAIYQLLYERTDTKTFQPPSSDDLDVNKYYFKYTRKVDNKQAWHMSIATIEDNLMNETDSGVIYGVGYRYKGLAFTQYISKYKNFNVYQIDLKYSFKKKFDRVKTNLLLIGKYIKLKNKESNDSSKNAKDDYLTVGIKLHNRYQDYHMGVGAYFGKRVFAVMQDGFKVQHHAMCKHPLKLNHFKQNNSSLNCTHLNIQ